MSIQTSASTYTYFAGKSSQCDPAVIQYNGAVTAISMSVVAFDQMLMGKGHELIEMGLAPVSAMVAGCVAHLKMRMIEAGKADQNSGSLISQLNY